MDGADVRVHGRVCTHKTINYFYDRKEKMEAKRKYAKVTIYEKTKNGAEWEFTFKKGNGPEDELIWL